MTTAAVASYNVLHLKREAEQLRYWVLTLVAHRDENVVALVGVKPNFNIHAVSNKAWSKPKK